MRVGAKVAYLNMSFSCRAYPTALNTDWFRHGDPDSDCPALSVPHAVAQPVRTGPICGQVAHYNSSVGGDTDRLPATMSAILRRRLLVRGFIQTEFAATSPNLLPRSDSWWRPEKSDTGRTSWMGSRTHQRHSSECFRVAIPAAYQDIRIG